jgi:polysaccharide export outer membrane protein
MARNGGDRLSGWLRRLSAACLLALCVACASGADPVPADAADAPQVALEDYRLGPGDRLRVIVFNEADLSGEFVVSPAGAISYPLVGEFFAQGKTMAEFAGGLTEALRRYVRQPNVSVEVLNYRPFFILGEVGEPGTYPYSVGLTVMNAVATASGFTPRADTRRVFIKHADQAAEREYRLTSTTPVQPGDTVRVTERRF